MYLNDVENHEQRAIEFASDLIFRLKTIICATDLKIVGTVSWDTRGGLNDGVIELIGLGVTQGYRRQGIAKELVLTLISETKKFFKLKGYKLRVIYFFMERSNSIARKFYESMGFREVSVIPAFYPNDDAVIWIKYF
ncbi:MAG: GNAT family N-acetyltransferase [Promethearchaeota archaeon]